MHVVQPPEAVRLLRLHPQILILSVRANRTRGDTIRAEARCGQAELERCLCILSKPLLNFCGSHSDDGVTRSIVISGAPKQFDANPVLT